MNNQAIVALDNGDKVTVKKLPLRKYSEVFLALQELPKKLELENFDSISNEEFFNILPGLIGKALPEFAKLISIATDIPEEDVLNLGLDEVADLLTAVLEVNNIDKVVSSIKKLMARKATPKKSTT